MLLTPLLLSKCVEHTADKAESRFLIVGARANILPFFNDESEDIKIAKLSTKFLFQQKHLKFGKIIHLKTCSAVLWQIHQGTCCS
jgi:hypothetical protein